MSNEILLKNSEVHTPFLMNLTMLLLDSDEATLNDFKSYVTNHEGICFVANNSEQALIYIETCQFDVVMCDISLNNGGTCFDFVDQAHRVDPEIAIIITTQQDIDNKAVMLTIKKNIYSLLKKPFEPVILGLLLLQTTKATKIARKNRYLADNLRNKMSIIQNEKNKIFFNTLTSLTNALEQKDEYTSNHSNIVSELSEKICLEYTDSASFIEDVTTAAKLHDIGKIGIRDEILFKKDKLTDKEYEIVKNHPEMSYKIIKPVDPIGKISEYVLHHHERWNGSGYPHKLKEKGIPAGARILAVADTFNALTSNRPYRKALDVESALTILLDGKSIDFDPEIVDILYKLIKIKRI